MHRLSNKYQIGLIHLRTTSLSNLSLMGYIFMKMMRKNKSSTITYLYTVFIHMVLLCDSMSYISHNIVHLSVQDTLKTPFIMNLNAIISRKLSKYRLFLFLNKSFSLDTTGFLSVIYLLL